jgi:hypothetical protein
MRRTFLATRLSLQYRVSYHFFMLADPRLLPPPAAAVWHPGGGVQSVDWLLRGRAAIFLDPMPAEFGRLRSGEP